MNAAMWDDANACNRQLRWLEAEKVPAGPRIKPTFERRAKITTNCCGKLVDPARAKKHKNDVWCGSTRCRDALDRWVRK